MKDADLCSLIMNIVDNAINAAISAHVPNSWIRFDIHIKSNYFVLICENTADFTETAQKEKTMSKHNVINLKMNP